MNEANRLGRVKSEKKDNDTVDGAFREAAGKGETVKMGLMCFFRKKKELLYANGDTCVFIF